MKHGLNTDVATSKKNALESPSKFMKFTTLSFLLSICLPCFADETNIIAKSDWSAPVELVNMETGHSHDIRGRLLIVAGNEPAYGGPTTDNAAMTFVELQNVTGAYSEALDLYFDSTKLNCVLTDEAGNKVPGPRGGFGGGFGRGLLSSWVVLPYNSTIRLFVNRGSKSPLDIYSNGWQLSHWSISSSDTNTYYLSGTLEIFTKKNSSLPSFSEEEYNRHSKGTLTFPTMKISVPK
jgi:hypothetical protein